MSGAPATKGLPISALALVAVNLLPLLGVLFAGWNVFTIVLLYWFETAVIGAINVLRMVTARGDMADMAKNLMVKHGRGDIGDGDIKVVRQSRTAGRPGAMGCMKLFMIPFFCVHFGGFMVGHLIFIFALLGGEIAGGTASPFDAFARLPSLVTPMLVFSLIGLLASHLFSFFTNYIGKGEYKTTTPPEQMMRPYGRVVVMHVAIIFGGFAAIALGQRLGLLLILVVGKTLIDLKLHLRDHRRAQSRATDTSPGAMF